MQPSFALTTRLAILGWVIAFTPASARPLNDTGETRCSNGTTYVDCSTVRDTHPGQDARYGRDVAAGTNALPPKTGFGIAGFDFTKIGNNGAVVANDAPFGGLNGQYACVRDNVTGLTWYAASVGANQWRDPNPLTNGGDIGSTATGSGTTAFAISTARTDAYCNRSSWRLPSLRELMSITRFGSGSGTCSGTFADAAFGNWPPNALLWTSQTVPAVPNQVFAFIPEGPAEGCRNPVGFAKTGVLYTVIVSE